MKKRLAIYVHHDAAGAVRGYAAHCLRGLKDAGCDNLVVVNGILSAGGREALESVGANILIRENEGFDFWGWKAGIESIGFDRLARDYDEVILTNNTFYGPIYPFSEMFDKMDAVKCDFWGINRHPVNEDSNMPEHIQSYWLAFGKKILKSPEWREFWAELQPHPTYDDMLRQGEFLITKFFEDRGFLSKTFMDFQKYSALLHDQNPTFLADIQVIEDKCPIIKRKFFYDKNFHIQNHFGGARILEKFMLEKFPDIMDMIYEDLIITANPSDINDRFGFYNVLQTDISAPVKTRPGTALIMFIHPARLIGYCVGYAKNMPEWADIFVVNTTRETQESCKIAFAKLPNKVDFRMMENRGRDNAALLIACADVIKKYKYVCFAHAKESKHWDDMIASVNFRDHCFDNLLFSPGYVNNIINAFENNPRMGLLIPPVINTNDLRLLGTEFFNDEKKLCREAVEKYFNLPADWVEDHPLAPFGGMLWFRTAAAKTLIGREWKHSDFPAEEFMKPNSTLTHALERLWSPLARSDGFYTAFATNDEYVKTYITNLSAFRRDMASAAHGHGFGFGNDIGLVGLFNAKLQPASHCGDGDFKRTYKLFGFIPFITEEYRAARYNLYKLFGIMPVMKIRHKTSGKKIYRLFSLIPLMVVRYKSSKTIWRLFGFLPILKS